MVKRYTTFPGDEHFSKFAIGSYGLDAWACAASYLDHRRTFIDVGAHIGHFTYHALGKFKRVVAIEPVLLNFSCLKENVANRCDKIKRKRDVQLMHAACGERSETVELYYSDPSNGQNSGAWELSTDPAMGRPVRTSVVAIDDLELEDVDLIKIDTQGWEERVINGAANTLRTCRPVLIVETVNEANMNVGLVNKVSNMGYLQRAQVQKNGVFVPRSSP